MKFSINYEVHSSGMSSGNGGGSVDLGIGGRLGTAAGGDLLEHQRGMQNCVMQQHGGVGGGLVRGPRHTTTCLPPPGCVGLEKREEARWWLITVLVPDKAGMEKCRWAGDLELYVWIESKIISGGTCRMKRWMIFMQMKSR